MDDDAGVEALRRAALEAGHAGGVLLVHRADARGFANAARAAVEEDGVVWIQARAAGGAPLEPARALVRALAPSKDARHEGPAALARRAWDALETRDRTTALALVDAHRSDERTARWWWSLARRLSRPGTPALLIAVLDPNESLPGSPWNELEARLAPSLGARRIAEEIREERETPPPARLPRALARTIAAALSGHLDRATRAAHSAAEAASRDDDLAAEAAADIAAAVVAVASGSPEAAQLVEAARATSRIAGDAALADALAGLASIHHALEGNLWRVGESGGSPLLQALAVHTRVRAGTLGEGTEGEDTTKSAAPRAHGRRVEALKAWSDALVLGARDRLTAAAELLERARWPMLAGRAWLDADDATRARACFERAGARALVARIDQAAAPGLSASGRAVASGGAPETVDALAPLVAAATREEVLVSALDTALGMIASRGGASIAERATIALRGRTSLLGAADARLSVPVRSPRTGVELGRLALDRLASDPPFSRDERRLAESIARFAGAAVDRCDAQSASRERERRVSLDPPPLDDRIAVVEKQTLIDALARHDGNLSRTARALKLSRNGLKMKMARHGLR